MRSEIRAPKMMRLSRSRPSWSVPSGFSHVPRSIQAGGRRHRADLRPAAPGLRPVQEFHRQAKPPLRLGEPAHHRQVGFAIDADEAAGPLIFDVGLQLFREGREACEAGHRELEPTRPFRGLRLDEAANGPDAPAQGPARSRTRARTPRRAR